MMNWRWVCAGGAIWTGAVAILVPALPETPGWLMSKGKTDRARWGHYAFYTILVKNYS